MCVCDYVTHVVDDDRRMSYREEENKVLFFLSVNKTSLLKGS